MGKPGRLAGPRAPVTFQAMRGAASWLAYLVGVFLGGALLAPVLYHAVQDLAARDPAWQALATQPFHRYVHRALLGLALVGLWPLLRLNGLRTPAALGWTSSPAAGRWLLRGLGLGVAGLGMAAALTLVAGGRTWRSGGEWGEALAILAGALGSAVAVAWIEETLFRGALQGTLRRCWPAWAAVVASSVVYAGVHFFARVRWQGAVEWHSGLAVVGRMLAGWADIAAWWPGGLNLVLAGLVLGAAFEATGNLYLPAGLHAGWVLAIKVYGASTQAVEAPVSGWGTERLTDGWVVLPVLGLTAGVLAAWLKRASARPTDP